LEAQDIYESEEFGDEVSLFRDFEEVKEPDVNVTQEKIIGEVITFTNKKKNIIEQKSNSKRKHKYKYKKNKYKKYKYKYKKNKYKKYKYKYKKNKYKKYKNKYKKNKKNNKGLIKPLNKWFKFSLRFGSSYSNFFKENNTTRETIKASVSISPIKYLFAGATFMKTINKKHNIYYEPDFSYSFGYSDWHQDTFSLMYSNYADNKFNPKGKKSRFNFTSGNWDLSYKTKIKDIYFYGNLKYSHKNKSKYFSVKASKKLNKLLFSVKYRRSLHIDQDRVTLAAKGYIYKKFYASASLYMYSHLNKQTFLEPDYAYSFGWRDSRKGKVSIMYSNYYTATRFPWRYKSGPPIEKGSISLSVRF